MEVAQNIQKLFPTLEKIVIVKPSELKDEVQKNARNEPDLYIRKMVAPKTSVKDGFLKYLRR